MMIQTRNGMKGIVIRGCYAVVAMLIGNVAWRCGQQLTATFLACFAGAAVAAAVRDLFEPQRAQRKVK